MSEHTAGPWRVVENDPMFIETEQEWRVAAIMLQDTVEEERANARLIAAAPIGYALAEAVLEWARTPGNHGGNPYLMEHVKLAETFMAQARGEQTKEGGR